MLDTCVLYPALLCDTLLRLASAGLYSPLWSADIEDELTRNLLKVLPTETVTRRLERMNTAFPKARVSEYSHLINAQTCHTKDRHVLAAALSARADVLLTFNLKDFPKESLRGGKVRVLHPDAYLLELLEKEPVTVRGQLKQQARSNRRAPRTFDDLCLALSKAGLHDFVQAVSNDSSPPQ